MVSAAGSYTRAAAPSDHSSVTDRQDLSQAVLGNHTRAAARPSAETFLSLRGRARAARARGLVSAGRRRSRPGCGCGCAGVGWPWLTVSRLAVVPAGLLRCCFGGGSCASAIRRRGAQNSFCDPFSVRSIYRLNHRSIQGSTRTACLERPSRALRSAPDFKAPLLPPHEPRQQGTSPSRLLLQVLSLNKSCAAAKAQRARTEPPLIRMLQWRSRQGTHLTAGYSHRWLHTGSRRNATWPKS